MKDIFNRRQRFSLRKYSFGVASVLLGTALFAAHTAQAEEVDAASTSSSDSSAAVGAEGTADLVKETATSVAQSDPTAAAAAEAPTSTLPISVASVSEAPKAEATTSEAAKEEASSSAKSEAAKPAENKATSEAAKPATPASTAASTAAASGKVETTASTTAATATPAAAAANHSAATAAPVAEEAPAAETAAAATSVKPNVTARGYSRFYSVGSAADRSATLDRAATDMTNAGALATRSSRTRRSLNTPDATSYTEGSAAATPTMSDANGAYVTNRPLTIPTPKDPGNAVTPGVNFQLNPNASQYTFAITDLHKFNEKYNTKYYYRLSKPYDNSTNVTLELVDGRNNSVVETKNISSAGTVTLGQSVLAPISGNSRAYIEFRFENIQDADKTNRSALRATWKYQGSVNDFNISRSALQIYDA